MTLTSYLNSSMLKRLTLTVKFHLSYFVTFKNRLALKSIRKCDLTFIAV